MKTNTDKTTIGMHRSTSVYNPHWYIERNGFPIIHIYDDGFNSPAQSQMIAQTIYTKLQNIFQDENQ